VLLGDDIVIGNKAVGELYLSIISDLGVDYSVPKTYISNTFFEFAKRLFWKGIEISPFPFSALKGVDKSASQFTNTLIELEEKGWTNTNGASSLVKTYFGMVLKLPSRLRNQMGLVSYCHEMITKIIRGVLPAGETLLKVFQELGTTLPKLSDFQAMSILENVSVEAYADSNPLNPSTSKRKSIGLGDLALKMYICTDEEFMSYWNEKVQLDTIDLMYDLPFMHCYGDIEERYMKLTRKSFTLKD
jgi:hypothetical protein